MVSNEKLRSVTAEIEISQAVVVETANAYCKMELNTLKFHLLAHSVENLNCVESFSMVDELSLSKIERSF